MSAASLLRAFSDKKVCPPHAYPAAPHHEW